MADTYRIPMPPHDPIIGLTDSDEDLTITGRFPLSAEQWSYLMNVLDRMRPGLVDGPREGT